MAKLQRWRRGRTAGEGSPVTDVPGDHAEDPVDDDAPAPEEGDPARADTLASGPEATATDADEPVTDADVPASVPDADAPAPHAADDVEEPPESALPALPKAGPRRAGFGGWITRGSSPREWLVTTLLQAAHAKQAVVTALAMGVAAIATGRPAREAGVIVVTVLVGQVILGWHNDITDKARDQRHGATGKPLADGRLDTGTLWYALVVAGLALIPLAITTGITAGCIYLASVAVGMLGNVLLRTGIFSFWSWAVSFAMLPAYLSYGGWGGQAVGEPPQTAIVILAALLGVGVHFMRSVWGLVADHEDGWTYLPLKLGLKIGATRLLALSTLFSVVIVVLLLIVGVRDGLSR